MQFFNSAQSESSNVLLEQRDLTIGKLLPKGGETLFLNLVLAPTALSVSCYCSLRNCSDNLAT